MDVGAILLLSGIADGKICGRFARKHLVCFDAVGIVQYNRGTDFLEYCFKH